MLKLHTMKKLLLLAGLLSLGAVNAQITVTHDGTPFVDGETFNYTNGAHLPILITNTSATETVYVKIKSDEVLNTTPWTGTDPNVQLCILEICYAGVVAGVTYPPSDIVSLAPGASTSNADHFYSVDPGVGGLATYSFTVIETDENGNETDELVSFTYVNQSTAGIDNFEALKNMGIVINNTVVKNTLTIDATVNATAQLYDTNGKLVKTAKIQNGTQAVDLSELNTAVYIAKFMTVDNKSTTIRIVKN